MGRIFSVDFFGLFIFRKHSNHQNFFSLSSGFVQIYNQSDKTPAILSVLDSGARVVVSDESISSLKARSSSSLVFSFSIHLLSKLPTTTSLVQLAKVYHGS